MKYDFLKDNYKIILYPMDIMGKEVIFNKINRTYSKNNEVYRIIAKTWDSFCATEIAQGKTSYKTINQLYRYEGIKVENEIIVLSISNTDYKEVYGTNIQNPDLYHKYGEGCMGNALGICSLIITKDNKFLILKRSGSVLELPNFYHLCAGHFGISSNTDNSALNIFSGIKKEILEEISVNEDSLGELSFIGLCRSLISFKPEILFCARISLNSNEIVKENLNFEHNSFQFLDDEELPIFLSLNHKSFVPAGKAAIICYLIAKYGIKNVNDILNQTSF